MAQNAQNKTEEQNKKSTKDLATENARLKLTATKENLADLRNKYDKGVVGLSIFLYFFSMVFYFIGIFTEQNSKYGKFKQISIINSRAIVDILFQHINIKILPKLE